MGVLSVEAEQTIATASPKNGFSAKGLIEDPARHSVVLSEVISGTEAVLAMESFLIERGLAFGQAGAMDHLAYFLDWASAVKKTPHLVLLGATRRQAVASPESLLGALLIFEYRLFGRGTRIFATDDTTGRRTLLAPPEERSRVARLAAGALMRRGAGAVLISFAQGAKQMTPEHPTPRPTRTSRWRIALRRREVRAYLPLEPSYDATLARMGQKTRTNLRYYRRRAEAQLGAYFVPAVEIGRKEFLVFNRECAYAVEEELAGWRYDAVRSTPGMFVAGVRGGDGRWLSLICARRFHGMVEIDWQMNRSDLPASSLGTVMRAYLIEHESNQGTRRLYFEGGTPHSMRNSFAEEPVCDLLVLRRGAIAPWLRRVGSRVLPKTNFVLEMLSEPGLRWHPWN